MAAQIAAEVELAHLPARPLADVPHAQERRATVTTFLAAHSPLLADESIPHVFDLGLAATSPALYVEDFEAFRHF